MTPSEFAIEIRRKIEAIRRDNTPLNKAAADTHSRMTERIFVQGKDSSGGQIGNYSTKDIWINPEPENGNFAPRNSGGFNPLRGKNGNTEFKTNPGRVRKTSYFKGWKGFRAAQNLQTSKVDLNYTGELFKDFGKEDKAAELKNVVKLSTDTFAATIENTEENNSVKAFGAEKRFGKKIFKLTAEEERLFYETLEKELKQALEL